MSRSIFSILFILSFALGACRGEEKWNLEFQNAAAPVDKVRIRSGGTCHRDIAEEKELLKVADAASVKALLKNIVIETSKSGFHCMCCGNPSIELYSGDKLILTLGFHHGRSLRWVDGTWPGDGLLTEASAEFVIKWMEERGVKGPREEVEEMKAEQKKSREKWNKWVAAMPPSVKAFMEKSRDDKALQELDEDGYYDALHKAASAGAPNKKEYILSLFKWYGSGEGLWSGFSSYESAAATLLLKYPSADLLDAIKDQELEEPLLEGVARLFGGWDFQSTRENDNKLLSKELKAKLLEHSLKSESEDKRGRAKNAFAR